MVGFQTKPRPQALKPPILLVAQDESRLVAVIQRCTAFEDEVEEHRRRRTEAAEGEEVDEQEVRGFKSPPLSDMMPNLSQIHLTYVDTFLSLYPVATSWEAFSA